ncbi:MAG TPA: peptidoglycan DD-metalloendopeptidase family protein [Gallionellaceae bacterium]|nr:peptidoglycan DD-metalloendopeptidase family protein [Gallionellaceae bacterium]
MTFKRSLSRLPTLVMALIVLAGCRASGNHRAPIEDRDLSIKKSHTSGKKPVQREQDSRPQFHVVQKGDTLYSIAFENGLDYREVAEQNNIGNPSAIQIGQQIKLMPPEEGVGERSRIESKPLAAASSMPIVKKDQPKVVKLPYSEQAVAQIEKMQQEPAQPALASNAPITVVKPPQESETGTDDSLEWGMPTKGKVIGEYSESANRKGVDIAGNKGQAVLASAAGKVVYSGSGLRGYGKLVIIKHNKTFLSAYAHNEQILVKEGQSVTKGQKIAEMGSTDADQVKLHFEIRKFGKPVDPAKFLNLAKS